MGKGSCFCKNGTIREAEKEAQLLKAAILMVSYGTAVKAAWERTLGRMEAEIRKRYAAWDLISAFTSRRMIEKWRQQGYEVRSEEEALRQLSEEGYQQVVLLPTHLVSGSEYETVAAEAKRYQAQFQHLQLGKPLLESAQARRQVAAAISREAHLGEEEVLVVIGHGTETKGSSVYPKLETELSQLVSGRAVVGTLRDGQSLIERLKTLEKRQIRLMPLLLTAGRHAQQDIAGEKPESIKSQLIRCGFTVQTIEKGMGELASIRSVYYQQLEHLIETR